MIKLFKLIFLSLLIFTPLKSSETSIKIRVNNKIITNMDITTEYNYLIALNNELRELDESIIIELAKSSIIRETIKKEELARYYDLDEDSDILNSVIKSFYKKLGIKDIEEFTNYLNEYDLEYKTVKDKIRIEMLWNSLIGVKYKNQVNIDQKMLEQQIEENFSNKNTNEYQLSEIVFQVKNEEDLSIKKNTIKNSIDEQGFSNTANIYSIANSSKFGGNIGWVEEKNLSKKIILAIKELKIGEVSQSIKIPSGFLVLKIENKKNKIIKINKKELLEEAVLFETNRQFSQYSLIYYNKINLNSLISEQ